MDVAAPDAITADGVATVVVVGDSLDEFGGPPLPALPLLTLLTAGGGSPIPPGDVAAAPGAMIFIVIAAGVVAVAASPRRWWWWWRRLRTALDPRPPGPAEGDAAATAERAVGQNLTSFTFSPPSRSRSALTARRKLSAGPAVCTTAPAVRQRARLLNSATNSTHTLSMKRCRPGMEGMDLTATSLGSR